MTGSPPPFDAFSSALGYLYQCRYALLLALQKGDDPNLCLSIEKLDDVAFHESPTTPTVARECSSSSTRSAGRVASATAARTSGRL